MATWPGSTIPQEKHVQWEAALAGSDLARQRKLINQAQEVARFYGVLKWEPQPLLCSEYLCLVCFFFLNKVNNDDDKALLAFVRRPLMPCTLRNKYVKLELLSPASFPFFCGIKEPVTKCPRQAGALFSILLNHGHVPQSLFSLPFTFVAKVGSQLARGCFLMPPWLWWHSE